VPLCCSSVFSFVFGIVANATLQYFFVLYPLIHCLTLSTSKCRNFALTTCISLYTVQGYYLIACSWCWLSFDNLAFYAASVDSTAQTGHPGTGDLQEELYQMVKHATIPLALSLLAYFHLYRYDFHFLFPRNSFYCFLLVCSFAKQPSLFSLFFKIKLQLKSIQVWYLRISGRLLVFWRICVHMTICAMEQMVSRCTKVTIFFGQ